MPLFTSLLNNFSSTLIATFSMVAILWGIERLFPKEKVSIASQVRSLKFWVFACIGTAIAVTTYDYLGQWLKPRPLLVVPLNSWLASPWVHWMMYVIAPVLGIISYDFFGYWLHRAQHRWLWRLHAVHHSIEELSGINSYFHWTEQFFRIAFISIPGTHLFGIETVSGVFLIELLVKLQGTYLHSPNSVHFGPVVRRVIADNRFHRIHHSVESRHFDKNFGAGTSIWDQLFGTAYFPAEDEWPATGVPGQPEARTITEYLWGPFRKAHSAKAEDIHLLSAAP